MPVITLTDRRSVERAVDDLADRDYPQLEEIATMYQTETHYGPLLLDLNDGTYGLLIACDDNYWDTGCTSALAWAGRQVPALAECDFTYGPEYPIEGLDGHGLLVARLHPVGAA